MMEKVIRRVLSESVVDDFRKLVKDQTEFGWKNSARMLYYDNRNFEREFDKILKAFLSTSEIDDLLEK